MQVDRVDFIIDRGLHEELKAQADAHVVHVREQVKKDHLVLEVSLGAMRKSHMKIT